MSSELSTSSGSSIATDSHPIGIIAGTGFQALAGLHIETWHEPDTVLGRPSGPLGQGSWHGQPVLFLNRHGEHHTLPPHQINYRANLLALQALGVGRVIAINSVGSMHQGMPPGTLALPNDLIDYTSGREHTFVDALSSLEAHVDMSEPYSHSLRQQLIAADRQGQVVTEAVYGATNGPRLETPAEIRRMRQDGCDLVGMTGMPEAALARELGIDYACIAVIVNWAAGFNGSTAITMDEIGHHIHNAEQTLLALVDQLMKDN